MLIPFTACHTIHIFTLVEQDFQIFPGPLAFFLDFCMPQQNSWTFQVFQDLCELLLLSISLHFISFMETWWNCLIYFDITSVFQWNNRALCWGIKLCKLDPLKKLLCNRHDLGECSFLRKLYFFRVISVSYLQPFCTFAIYLYIGWEGGQIGEDFHGEVVHLRCWTSTFLCKLASLVHDAEIT